MGYGALCDSQIKALAESVGILTPYDGALVNPASVDLRVGQYGRVERNYPFSPRPESELWGEPFDLTDGYVLRRGESILLDTMEYVYVPSECKAEMLLKSSAGREGLDIYKAGYVDPGFRGTLTFRLRNDVKRPFIVKPGLRLVQLVLYTMAKTPSLDYSKTGRYLDQTGPTPARPAKGSS